VFSKSFCSRAVISGLVLGAGLLTACTSSSGKSVAVTGTDDACTLAQTELPAGKLTFEFTNRAGDVNELYVLKANGEVVSEAENVTKGVTRPLNVNLAAGDYLVRCKPGQKGDGFSSAFTVTGSGGAAQAQPTRVVEFEAADFTYHDLKLDGLRRGDVVRFVMTNDGEQSHEFEVLDPKGETVGEIGETEPGKRGEATITLAEPGTYTYQCILEDAATHKEHAAFGMRGRFTVS
jgi:uncharacterized cupredoxin-like copper-binding protein